MQFNGSHYTININELGKRLGEEKEAYKAKGRIAGTYMASAILDKEEKNCLKQKNKKLLKYIIILVIDTRKK